MRRSTPRICEGCYYRILELHREPAFAVARGQQHLHSYQRVDVSKGRAVDDCLGGVPEAQEVVRNTVIRDALVLIKEHLMSEKFDPAPLDKYAAKPGKNDALSDKAHGELDKG